MSSSITLILLVGVFLAASAHGKILPLNRKDNVTSLMVKGILLAEKEAASSSIYILDKTKDESRPSSAVQDWSLVCQQLCGAALGGAACIPHCGNATSEVSLNNSQIANAKTFMAFKDHLICPKLCGLQLGDAVCTCTKWIAKDAISENTRNATNWQNTNVCAIFCDTINVTLTGCSPCLKALTQDIEIRNVKEISKKAIELIDIQNTTTVAPPKTETPNWNQLCAALCKTGDGGSLCNCDLSPFMV